MPIDARTLIDRDRYPVDAPESAMYADMLAACREDLRAVGCSRLPGFVRPEHIPAIAEECDRTAPSGHRSFNDTNPYFTQDDDTLPSDHPRRHFEPRSNIFVPADNFGPDSLLRAVYEWPPFMPFIRDALEEPVFHRYADPLADVIVNVVEEGGGFPWHFDTNSYTVTLAIQNGDAGGAFEYCPNLRHADDENYAGVGRVIAGDRTPVHTLPLEPGDLQIFRGRYSLHRVTPVQGPTPRYVGIFSFVEEPDMVGRVERTRQLYGRVLPIHEQREALIRGDALAD